MVRVTSAPMAKCPDRLETHSGRHYRRKHMLTRKSVAALALSLLVPAALAAQSSRPSLIVFGQGGGNSALTDLNQAETAKLRTGWTVGGGVGLQVNQNFAVRGTFDYAKSEVEGLGAGALNNQKLTQLFYGGEV